MLSISSLFEDLENESQDEKEDYFENRTNYHIYLVGKYLDKIIKLNDPRIVNSILEKEKLSHDESKFNQPEHDPYVDITWKYYLEGQNKKAVFSGEQQKLMNQATFHHVKNNKHHPEYWDDNSTIKSINSKDRDKAPDQIVDATKMPLTYVASMVADWCAVSEEKNTCPYEWAKNNINKRWKFNKNQIELIHDLLDNIWISK